MTLMTSLAEIRSYRPCADFSKIRNHFGVSAADAKTHSSPFPLALMLETNDIWDVLWVFDRVAPQPLKDTFLIFRLDRGEYSALKSLRLKPIDSDWWRACEASIQRTVALLHRRISGDDVATEMATAVRAAVNAAAAARSVDTTRAGATAHAAAYAAANAAANVALATCSANEVAAAAAAGQRASAHAARDLAIVMEASI
jgi:hypothetical protein